MHPDNKKARRLVRAGCCWTLVRIRDEKPCSDCEIGDRSPLFALSPACCVLGRFFRNRVSSHKQLTNKHFYWHRHSFSPPFLGKLRASTAKPAPQMIIPVLERKYGRGGSTRRSRPRIQNSARAIRGKMSASISINPGSSLDLPSVRFENF